MRFNLATAAEKIVQFELNGLWWNEYTKDHTKTRRNRIAWCFAKRWLDPSKVKIDKPFIRHPATARKVKQRNYTVAEVLADFVMRVDQVVEKEEMYPIFNQDTEIRREGIRRDRERSIIFESEYDQAVAEVSESKTPGATYRKPPYSIDESNFNNENPVESVLFADPKPTVESFRRQLAKVKRQAARYATRYTGMGYDYADTVRRIRRLDLERIRECLECGQPFYAHDLRRQLCDLQHGKTEKGERSESSMCELLADKQRSVETRNNSGKSA